MGFVGGIVVLVCVFGGFVLHGGNMRVINQPTEFLIIGGAAIGGFITANPIPIMKLTVQKAIHALIGKGPSKAEYLELLQLLFQLFQIFRKDGPQAVERHIEEPEKSEIFKQYPSFLKNHHAVDFLCDTMKITLSADLSQYDVDDLLTGDIKAAHTEEHMASHALGQIGEALPGLGIVAAVLGVVITMGILDQGTEAIGGAVASALVGTFLGVLACYGFVNPITSKMNNDIEQEGRYLEVIKAALIALQRGSPPLVCVEFARRTILPNERPTFSEVDAAAKGAKKAA